MIKIPIFIISHDRFTTLKQTIESFKQIKRPYEIVIHDNSSTFPPLIEYLKELNKKEDVTVYFSKKNSLAAVTETVTDFMKKSKSDYYVVTDPDIRLLEIDDDILDVYIHLLNKFKVTVVGPMLQIDDIPDHYPLKKKAIASHTKQFWRKKPSVTKWKGKSIKYQKAPIDTTFGIYRRSFRFKRLNNGIRVYKPYSAQHLDWYIDPKNMEEDQKYYLKSSSEIGHWSSTFLKNKI